MRFNSDLAATGQAQNWLSLRGSLAYQRASGDLSPMVSANWNEGGKFTVAGAPLARNATLVDVGLAARLSANSLLELGYNGMLANGAHDTGVNARFSLQF